LKNQKYSFIIRFPKAVKAMNIPDVLWGES